MQENKKQLGVMIWYYVGRIIVGAILVLIISFRVLAIPFVILWAIKSPRRSRKDSAIVTTCMLVTLASPIDLGMPGVGFLEGNHRGGIRLVHVSVGMPDHEALQARYGEYVTTGCSGLCIYNPCYWIVWW